MRRTRTSIERLLMAVGVFGLLHGCCTAPALIRIGSPHDRYDHNRTRPIASPVLRDGKPTKVVDQAYAPVGNPFPVVASVPPESSADALAVAHLVPIFTGVALPLSSAPTADGRSDRDDLVDFLADGPNAQHGVTPGDLSGDIAATAVRYEALLDVLQSEDMLQTGGRIDQWAAAHGIASTKRVVDARYRSRAFAETLALYCDNFWFVLYRLPTNQRFTRLVVVPVHISGQGFDEKTPAGKDGRCGEKQ